MLEPSFSVRYLIFKKKFILYIFFHVCDPRKYNPVFPEFISKNRKKGKSQLKLDL